MRKGTKEIRKVFTGIREYYVYDLDEDAFGKCKRLYGKTKGELEEKIARAKAERKAVLNVYKPKTKQLSEYVNYYFKNAVGSIPSRNIKRLLTLFERTVFNSEIDKEIDTITEEEMQNFYDNLHLKFPLRSVQEADEILRKVFDLATEDFDLSFDFSKVKTPTSEVETTTANYIMTPKEFDDMLDFCIADNCTRYGSNERIIIFCMLTGAKLSFTKTLRVNNVNLQDKKVVVGSKTLPLSARAVEWIETQMADGNLPSSLQENELLFTNSNGVSPTLQSIQYTIQSITKRCGFPKGITGKTIVKAYVISELDKGVSPEELTIRLGLRNRMAIADIQAEYEVRQALF